MKPPAGRQASLTRRLVLGMLAALLLVWAGFVAVGYRTGVHEADELTDGHLAGTAALLLTLDLPPFVQGASEPTRTANLNVAQPSLSTLKRHDYQFSLSVLVRWRHPSQTSLKLNLTHPPPRGQPRMDSTSGTFPPWNAISGTLAVICWRVPAKRHCRPLSSATDLLTCNWDHRPPHGAAFHSGMRRTAARWRCW